MELIELLFGFCLDLTRPILPKDITEELPRWAQWVIVCGLAATLIWVIAETFG